MLSRSRFQELLQHTRKKTRGATNLFFVDGWRWLEEALALPDPPECVVIAACAARSAKEIELLERARARASRFFDASDDQVARLAESISSPGVVALVRWRPPSLDDVLQGLPPSGPAAILVLDGVGDPGNAGTLIRSADWFGAAAVVLGNHAVDPTNAKVVRATMGSLFRLPVIAVDSLPDVVPRLRAARFAVAATVVEGGDAATDWPERTALIVGNEANGVDPGLRAVVDRAVCIPRYGRAESLNAAIAGSLLMADWRRAVSGR